MKPFGSRILATAVLAILGWLLLAGATASRSKGPLLQPNKLVIESTTDVRGKTSPCG